MTEWKPGGHLFQQMVRFLEATRADVTDSAKCKAASLIQTLVTRFH